MASDMAFGAFQVFLSETSFFIQVLPTLDLRPTWPDMALGAIQVFLSESSFFLYKCPQPLICI